MIELGFLILLTHLLTGLCLFFLMTYDLGIHHKKNVTRLLRIFLVGWWLFHAEHLMREGHYSYRQLISELLLLSSLVVLSAMISSIKKLLR